VHLGREQTGLDGVERLASLAEPSHPAWIETRPGIPYFVTEHGEPWTPIGQNDAISWPELNGLFRRRDLAGVERHLRWLKAHGVTCLRLMLEYAQVRHRYIEKPVGRFPPNMVQLWDDLFALCEKVGLHILLTPVDTFFMWTHWQHHPYNAKNGGPCSSRRRWLTCADTREAIKARLAFASDRWGGSPALFAWDIWNEIHPAHGGDDPGSFAPFIDDVATWLRAYEIARHGRAHLQTVSIFGPELVKAPELCEPIFRHPALDFANTHLYEHGTIDDPRDTVAPALSVGRLIAQAVREAGDLRPVFDSEHGPIHSFKDKHKTLPDAFDDEYFRHIQWAHLASGGAGGGMRWPNRHPHVLTPGMREAQRGLAAFLPLIDWTRFARRTLDGEIGVADGVAAFGCGDGEQAVVWLLRTDTIGRDGTLSKHAPAIAVDVGVPGLAAGRYRATCFDTSGGRAVSEEIAEAGDDRLNVKVPALVTDVAVAIRRI
jgi:mannan endo-1,4-beta-mannosidase